MLAQHGRAAHCLFFIEIEGNFPSNRTLDEWRKFPLFVQNHMRAGIGREASPRKFAGEAASHGNDAHGSLCNIIRDEKQKRKSQGADEVAAHNGKFPHNYYWNAKDFASDFATVCYQVTPCEIADGTQDEIGKGIRQREPGK